MAAITESVEISRRPEDVFAYLDDLSRHGEWQDQIVSVRVDAQDATGAGKQLKERLESGAV